MIFVISGPSGCGKSTLVRNVLEEIDNIEFSVSFTTRKMRDEEEEGKDYYFVSKEKFEQMIEEKMLAEWAVVHGHYYGTSRREIEKKGSWERPSFRYRCTRSTANKREIQKSGVHIYSPSCFPGVKEKIAKERPGET